MIQMVAVDMDGTLLRDDKSFSQELYPLVKELKKKGCYFVIATGNQYELIQRKFAPIQDDLVYLCENGAKLVVDGRCIYTNTLEEKLQQDTLKLLEKEEEIVIVMCGTQHAYIEKKHMQYDSFMRNFYENIEYVDDLEKVEDSIMKYSLACFTENYFRIIDRIAKDLSPDLQLVTTGHTWFDIFHANLSKGTGMKILQEKLGIPRTDCAAFGDQMNDVGLLESCEESYCMVNGVEPLKLKAKYITEYDNNHDGVIQEIKKWDFKNGKMV